MLIHEVRSLSNQELAEELDKAYQELMTLRFRNAVNQLTDTNMPRKTRKNIARIRTVMRERQAAGE